LGFRPTVVGAILVYLCRIFEGRGGRIYFLRYPGKSAASARFRPPLSTTVESQEIRSSLAKLSLAGVAFSATPHDIANSLVTRASTKF
jgi:hypothetical protein